jgi:hypothetical protein
MTTAVASWPVIVAAATPPAPIERTVMSAVATYAAPSRPPIR